MYWRYVVEINRSNNTIYPYPLLIAALSIYETTPIAYLQLTKEYVIDPDTIASIKQNLLKKNL